MPFEPLATDETRPSSGRRVRDADDEMLFGCTGFVLAAIGGYVLSVWPFLAFQGMERLESLGRSGAVGLVPCALLGAICTRRYGIAGACGFVASGLSSGLFFYMRLRQVFLAGEAREAPVPDYAGSFIYLLPAAWILAVLLIAAIALPSEKADPVSKP